MIDFAKAKRLAEEHLREAASGGSPSLRLELLHQYTEEHSFGWVFFYDSEQHIKTGALEDALAGNAPFIVERSAGRILVTGTARPVEEYLDAYRLTGDPHGRALAIIKLVGWRREARTISAIKAVRKSASIGHAEAKRAVEACLAGEQVEIATPSEGAARRLREELDAFGIEAQVLPAGRDDRNFSRFEVRSSKFRGQK